MTNRLLTRVRPAALLLGATLLASCGEGGPQDILGTVPGSRIRFFNMGIGAPSVNFYAGDVKMTAISSAACAAVPAPPACLTTGIEATVGVAYGASSSGGQYSGIAPGQHTFTARIATAADNGVTIARATQNVENGKAYSYFVAGFYDAAARTADAFVIEDAVPFETDFTIAAVRFVNASPNAVPLQVHLRNQATSQVTVVGNAMAYRGATPFITVAPGTYDIAIVPAGVTPVFSGAQATVGVTFVPGGYYSTVVRGDWTLLGSTTAANRPLTTIFRNR